MIPAAIGAGGSPLNGEGTLSESAVFSRIPAISTSASVKPSPTDTEWITVVSNVNPLPMMSFAVPRTQQLVVMSARYTPSDEYSDGEIFLSTISRI